jgi:hypothetical protein
MLFLSLSVYTIFNKEILYKYHDINVLCYFYHFVFILFLVRKSYTSTMLLTFYAILSHIRLRIIVQRKIMLHVHDFYLGKFTY